MSNVLEEFVLSILFKADKSSASQAAKSVEQVKKKLTETETAAVDFGATLKGVFGKALGFAGITLSAAALVSYGKSAIDAASQLEQMEEKFNAVFLDLSDEADAWAGNLADSIGRSKNSIKTYLADQQNLLVGFGMERDAAMEMSEEMVSAAINIASFNNIEDDDAINAMSKALMGETESAKRLGAVLNDNTIAMAMEDLGYKQKFTDLDEATKMQVRYHSIVMQSPDAFREENGVIGDAALSMDTYESRLRQFNATMTDIQTNIGKALLPYAAKILEYISKAASGIRKLTEKLGDANEEGSAANKLLKALDSVLSHVYAGVQKVVSIAGRVVNRLGGIKNVIQILSVAIGAMMAIKIVEKVKSFMTTANGLSKVLGAVNFKVLAIIAVIVALYLIIEDIVYFMQGKDSLIGDLINANGGDADKVREVFQSIFDTIKNVAAKIVEVAKLIGGALASFWDKHGQDIMQAGAEFLQGIFAVIVGAIAGLASAIGPLIDHLKTLFKAFYDLFTGNWGSLGDDIINVAKSIINIFTSMWDSFATVVNNILGIHLPENVGQMASDAMDALVEGLKGAWGDITGFFDNLVTTITTTIGELPGKMLQWGKDMITNFISGLKEVPVVGTVVGIAEDVAKNLHHSTPDEGPLKDDDEWGYDFMDNFIQGIEAKKDDIRSAVQGVAQAMADARGGLGAINANVTGSLAASGITRNASIIQNISFSNTFNGDTRSNQMTAASAMKGNAEDTTALLSRGIAYAR